MGNLLIEVMDRIAEECREEGYYPDVVELMEMAIKELNNG